MDSTSTIHKVVPGALPPVDKTSKKKRKPKVKGTSEPEVVDTPTATSSAPVADEQLSVPSVVQEDQSAPKKNSPVVDLLNKRVRNFSKKIQRVKEYLAKPADTLNEDQIKVISTLPSLESVIRELEDVKKTIEPLDTQQQHDLNLYRAEIEKAADDRVLQSVKRSKDEIISKMVAVVSLISLHNHPSSGIPMQESEKLGLHSFVEALTSTQDCEATLAALIDGEGEWEGLSTAQLFAIAIRPPPSPELENDERASEALVEEEQEVQEQEIPIAPLPDHVAPATPGAGGFHFMQESELEHSAEAEEINGNVSHTSLDDNIIAGSDDIVADSPAVDIPGEGHTQHQMDDPVVPPSTVVPSSEPLNLLDWAADDGLEGELPSINSLHEKFGRSGDVTPEAEVQQSGNVVTPTEKSEQPAAQLQQPDHQAPAIHDDGFTAVGRRGGSGTINFRGDGFRGGERGRGRGGFKSRGGGESRGRGRGGFRGADRGFRGAPRGRSGFSAPTINGNGKAA